MQVSSYFLSLAIWAFSSFHSAISCMIGWLGVKKLRMRPGSVGWHESRDLSRCNGRAAALCFCVNW
ncbi:hypothetical protein L211DRAFT_843273 [Terfezia boudieri ATCC MYA-4762]|uniref:Uncharacterized protein n=1 Tax=Terfezia boudieri ATCC MYA-4762 TaxID=1051890 RepID=A0A3N4L899_9PEZI|nr:hypothetical protein L211DRAFT_843273 [Terfezia boudieri ATCC MYA-4762]